MGTRHQTTYTTSVEQTSSPVHARQHIAQWSTLSTGQQASDKQASGDTLAQTTTRVYVIVINVLCMVPAQLFYIRHQTSTSTTTSRRPNAYVVLHTIKEHIFTRDLGIDRMTNIPQRKTRFKIDKHFQFSQQAAKKNCMRTWTTSTPSSYELNATTTAVARCLQCPRQRTCHTLGH